VISRGAYGESTATGLFDWDYTSSDRWLCINGNSYSPHLKLLHQGSTLPDIFDNRSKNPVESDNLIKNNITYRYRYFAILQDRSDFYFES